MWSGKYGEEQLLFCEARIRVVNRYPDRAKALGAVLSLDASTQEERLLRWAIDQLKLMHSPAADAELKRFQTELAELRRDSVLYQRWYNFRREFDSEMARERERRSNPAR
jgi:hypothetical protein